MMEGPTDLKVRLISGLYYGAHEKETPKDLEERKSLDGIAAIRAASMTPARRRPTAPRRRRIPHGFSCYCKKCCS
jgi:hypothetical protein